LPFSLFCLGIGALGFWRPKVISAERSELQKEERHVAKDLHRLIRHDPFRKALMLSCLWSFSPISAGILTFLVIDRFGGTMATVGQNQSLAALGGLPVVLLFGLLATRFNLRWILFVGIAASVFQFAPLLTAHNLSGLLFSSLVSGLLGNLVDTALLDLKMRSCPEGLEGLSLSLIGLTMSLMGGASIWLGAQIFQKYGIVPVVYLSGFGSLVTLPFILRLPKAVSTVE